MRFILPSNYAIQYLVVNQFRNPELAIIYERLFSKRRIVLEILSKQNIDVELHSIDLTTSRYIFNNIPTSRITNYIDQLNAININS